MKLTRTQFYLLGVGLTDSARWLVHRSGNLRAGPVAEDKLQQVRMRKLPRGFLEHVRDSYLEQMYPDSNDRPNYLRWDDKAFLLENAHLNNPNLVIRKEDYWIRDKKTHADDTPFTWQEREENAAKRAIRYQAGNCGELANVIMFTIRHAYMLRNVDLVAVKIGFSADGEGDADHAYVMMYEPKKTYQKNIYENIESDALDILDKTIRQINSNDEANELPNGVVCDPWVWRVHRLGNKNDCALWSQMIDNMGISRALSLGYGRVESIAFPGEQVDMKLDKPFMKFSARHQSKQKYADLAELAVSTLSGRLERFGCKFENGHVLWNIAAP